MKASAQCCVVLCQALVDTVINDRGTEMITMSNATEEGVHQVKATACDMLLQHRVER